MRTRTAPWDYERNPPIIPQKVKLCASCGGWMIPVDGGQQCLFCDGSEWVEVMEGKVQDYRASLPRVHATPPDSDSPFEKDKAECQAIQNWLDDNWDAIPEVPL